MRGGGRVEHVPAETYHGRRGPLDNAFRYRLDYVMLEPERAAGPALFGRLVRVRDRDHGGPQGRGEGVRGVRAMLAEAGLPHSGWRLALLTQPRLWGHVFNPVSFWFAHDSDDTLRTVVAEVTNTFGDRLSYLCVHDDLRPIAPGDVMIARKRLHVSPFQPVDGVYRFRFDVTPAHVRVRIDHRNGEAGVYATLSGPRRPLTDRAILAMALGRPLGSRRVLALIHWQALRLWWRGARYRGRPVPPKSGLSRG